jgi:lysyl-tRNA synthetase class 2
MSADEWWPLTNKDVLHARAKLLQDIRQFFLDADILEVETPIISRYSNTDPQLEPFRVAYVSSEQAQAEARFLQTSPEFAMKRLLAAGSGPIYQICKVFRNAELGRRHNPEFSMLEWYRPGFDEHQLMDEVEALIKSVLPQISPHRCSYQQLFLSHLDIDPFTAMPEELGELARRKLDLSFQDQELNSDAWLDLLFSHVIEPQLSGAVFVYDYPPSQAALAEVETNSAGLRVARRFELIIEGMEIANGYRELRDPQEQRRRFEQDLEKTGEAGRLADTYLLDALEYGLPACAGVALGLDRLLMLQFEASSIEEVLSFPFTRA